MGGAATERINRRRNLGSKEEREARKGGEKGARGRPTRHASSQGVRREGRRIE